MTVRRRPALVVFDCDGVLVDSERMEVGTLAEALAWVGADLDPVAVHERHRGGMLARLVATIEDHLAEPVPAWFVPRYRELQLARLRSVEPVPGAIDTVAAVAAAGVARCVVSGGPMAKMEVSLGATGLWDAFAPDIFSCYDIGDHKPSPGIYLHALRMLGVDAADAVAVEDSVTGVAAAVAAGVAVIGLARDTPAADLLAAGASVTAATMSDVGEALAGR